MTAFSPGLWECEFDETLPLPGVSVIVFFLGRAVRIVYREKKIEAETWAVDFVLGHAPVVRDAFSSDDGCLANRDPG